MKRLALRIAHAAFAVWALACLIAAGAAYLVERRGADGVVLDGFGRTLSMPPKWMMLLPGGADGPWPGPAWAAFDFGVFIVTILVGSWLFRQPWPWTGEAGLD